MTAGPRSGEGPSPRLYARIAGALYLITIVLGAVEEIFIRGRIFVAKNAAATAANLTSMEFLWRLGIASELFLGIITVVVAMILYALLKPVSKDLALLMPSSVSLQSQSRRPIRCTWSRRCSRWDMPPT